MKTEGEFKKISAQVLLCDSTKKSKKEKIEMLISYKSKMYQIIKIFKRPICNFYEAYHPKVSDV